MPAPDVRPESLSEFHGRQDQLALLLRHWLLEQPAHRKSPRAFSLSNALIVKARPTFLLPFADLDAAVAAQRTLFARAEGLHNWSWRQDGSPSTDPAIWVGSSRNGTWYLDRPKCKLRAYVKRQNATYGYCQFLGFDAQAGERLLKAEAERYRRGLSKFCQNFVGDRMRSPWQVSTEGLALEAGLRG